MCILATAKVFGLRCPLHRHGEGPRSKGFFVTTTGSDSACIQEPHAKDLFGLIIASTVTGGSFAVGSVSGGVSLAGRRAVGVDWSCSD